MLFRSHLAAGEVIGDALVLSVLRFADELVDAGMFRFPRAGKAPASELRIARMLVKSLAADWDPAAYSDQYQQNLLRIIDRRLKGKKDARLEPATPQRSEKVVDLMERLRQSLAAANASKRSGSAKASGKRATRAVDAASRRAG